ncbi:potassium-transporting ATPase subunit KdpA [Deefgea sp. CFH1-16]|uniref:potassium-transporting ATPase subunit KdpA n=1 Tax=Deefgea sp. CFH1-16 TaxID=2675457 RepID=UPI0015F4FCDF|nr:potassium-transporting ATPase subunit KdpA [Deefgea sp. CFH1-16]MBM5574924.1 potassium-transporting ATPase subunit KdpA [Deefgea sp. CFH1-16]
MLSTNAVLQLILYLGVLIALAWPVSLLINRVMAGQIPLFLRWLSPIERGFYRLAGVKPEQGQKWQAYALGLLLFNLLGFIALYVLQRSQGGLPLNPQAMLAVSADSAFNTAISFVANTNWQGYSGEATMSYLTQMLGLTVQNFLSAASGIAVAIALIRGFANHQSQSVRTAAPAAVSIGNVWADLTRITLYLLMPIAFVLALLLAGQGVIQNFKPYQTVSTLDAVSYSQAKLDAAGQPMQDAAGKPVMETISQNSQLIAMGPVASQEAIKMLGTNGGGFFNANSAHPFENPTPLSNFLQMLAIFLIPAALCFTFGHRVADHRQGWTILAAMTILFVLAYGVIVSAEQVGNPAFAHFGVDQTSNLEGKETRFGIVASSLFATITTAASCGAVNAMHDSFTPMGGMITMLLMQLGEVVFGGVGSGLYGMLVFAILAVFIAGLMVGRTPEYLGKKIESFEMKMTALVILVTPLLVLLGTALAVSTTAGQAGIFNPGAHGFSEVLYALSSAANNNGSAFAGLSANTPFYNVLLGLAMWFGRFAVIIAVLAMAGSLAAKPRLAVNVGTLPTHGPLFVMLLVGAVLLVGMLNYIPALALGPIVEQLQMIAQ